MFKQNVKVSNVKNDALFFEEEFWIDTGALYSFIPLKYLKEIGFEPQSSRTIVFADGRTGKNLFGYCDFEIKGNEGKNTCPVVAGANDSLFLLGATALENFGLEADPVNKRLNPLLAIIGGFLASK